MGLNENNFFARLAIFAIKFTHIQKRNNKKKISESSLLDCKLVRFTEIITL